MSWSLLEAEAGGSDGESEGRLDAAMTRNVRRKRRKTRRGEGGMWRTMTVSLVGTIGLGVARSRLADVQNRHASLAQYKCNACVAWQSDDGA